MGVAGTGLMSGATDLSRVPVSLPIGFARPSDLVAHTHLGEGGAVVVWVRAGECFARRCRREPRGAGSVSRMTGQDGLLALVAVFGLAVGRVKGGRASCAVPRKSGKQATWTRRTASGRAGRPGPTP